MHRIKELYYEGVAGSGEDVPFGDDVIDHVFSDKIEFLEHFDCKVVPRCLLFGEVNFAKGPTRDWLDDFKILDSDMAVAGRENRGLEELARC